MGALSFNEMEIDALGEMMNISLGASATAMSTLLGSTVHITTPKVKILTRDQFEFKKLEPAVGVEIAYDFFKSYIFSCRLSCIGNLSQSFIAICIVFLLYLFIFLFCPYNCDFA